MQPVNYGSQSSVTLTIIETKIKSEINSVTKLPLRLVLNIKLTLLTFNQL